jgi:hypothetical protein
LNRRRSQWLAAAGMTLLLWALLQPVTPARLICSAPLAVAMVSVLYPPARWGLPIALLMLPYFSYGVMELVVSVDARWNGMVIAALTVGIFLAAMDSLRRV